jgi:GDP-4-dehydro-6-deoxy-D-mannose reductase
MTEKVVVVTGCGGFMGRTLLSHLRVHWRDARMRGVGRGVLPEGFPESAQFDLNDEAKLRDWIGGIKPDVIFHAAGRITGHDWTMLYQDNVAATLSLLRAVEQTSPKSRVVIAGSAAECGAIKSLPVREGDPLRPVSPYGVSKAWQSLAALSFAFRGLDVLVARIFNIVGRGTPVSTSLGTFASQLREAIAGRREPVLKVGNLSARRDFVDVDDIAEALRRLAENGRAGELYNVCSGRPVGIGEALNRMVTLSGIDVQIETDPARLRPDDVLEVIGSFQKISTACGWSPRVPLDSSLAAMLSD